MNHPDRVTLLDHALGLLEGPARAEVEVHVQDCAECAEAARALSAEQEALRAGLAAPEVDARGVERRVLEAVRGLRVASGRLARSRGPRRLLVAAVVLVAAGAAVLAYRDHTEQRQRQAGLVHRVVLSERAALEVR